MEDKKKKKKQEEEIQLLPEFDDVLGVRKEKCLQQRYYEEIEPLRKRKIKSSSTSSSSHNKVTHNHNTLTSEERLRNFQGILNIIIVSLAVLVSLLITYTVMILVSPFWKKRFLNEPACLTALNIGLGSLGVFLFFISESFAEDFELALDRRCSTFLIKFATMMAFSAFLVLNGLIIYSVPSVFAIIYEEKYFSSYVLAAFQREGIICVALACWCCYISFHKLATRITQRRSVIEKDIISFFLQKHKNMESGEILSLTSRNIYEYLKKNHKLKCSYSRLRKCAIKLLYENRNCEECKQIQNVLEIMGKMSKNELLSIRKK